MASTSHLVIRIIDSVSFQGRTQTWLPAIRYCPGAQEEYTVQGDSFGTWYAFHPAGAGVRRAPFLPISQVFRAVRSEEHTSELQSLAYLVCRLLLEKKK